MTSYDFGYLGNTATSGDIIKDRALISLPDSTNQYGPNGSLNSPLELASQEASSLVSSILMYYDTAFDGSGSESGLTIPLALKEVVADFAMSIFKRRWMYNEVSTKGPFDQGSFAGSMDASGWYALAFKKLQLYIRSKYVQPTFHIWSDDGSTGLGGVGGYKEQ